MEIKVYFKASFIRQLNKLPTDLQEDAIHRIELFKNGKNHKFLRVHKLSGSLNGCHSFSVDFRNRIVFEYLSAGEVALLSIGDHGIYQ